MRVSILLLALLAGCGTVSRDIDPNVRTHGIPTAADLQYQESMRPKVKLEPGNALARLADYKSGSGMACPRFDIDPQTKNPSP